MNRYEKISCPICKKPLQKDEDVVVCPECGAPYHRKCYMETGHCIFPELHATGQSWKPEKVDADGREESSSQVNTKICPRCGGENPSDGLFCKFAALRLMAGSRGIRSKAAGSLMGCLRLGRECRFLPLCAAVLFHRKKILGE